MMLAKDSDYADEARTIQDEVAAARPDIDERTAQLVSKGRWAVPGYKASHLFDIPRRGILYENPTDTKIGEIRRPFRVIKISLAPTPTSISPFGIVLL